MLRATTADRLLLTRRGLLQFGGYAAIAHALGRLAPAAGHATAAVTKPIRSCILLVYYGGPSHLDTWDMKPHAPAEVRGEFRPIASSVPGRFVCEHLPQTARMVDKLAVIRSMHHPMTNHNSAMYETLVGRRPGGGDNEILGSDRNSDFPGYGSALSFLAEQGVWSMGRSALLNVAVPHVMHNVVVLPGQNAGFLDARYDPFQVTSDPSAADFCIAELELPADLPVSRLEDRQALAAAYSRATRLRERAGWASYRRRAFELLRRPQARLAFDMAAEADPLRDRYGRNKLGQSLLLARRLVENGARFVNVNDKVYNGQTANWDSHQDNFPRHKDHLLPPADQGFSALVEDLDQRGLLDSTLVVALGEFGRTPRINAQAGRDHWPQCYSVVLAGGGIAGGAAFGSSDRIGAYPATDPVTPGDLAATIFWRFGLDHTLEVHDPLGRPFRLATGEPLRQLFPAA